MVEAEFIPIHDSGKTQKSLLAYYHMVSAASGVWEAKLSMTSWLNVNSSQLATSVLISNKNILIEHPLNFAHTIWLVCFILFSLNSNQKIFRNVLHYKN